MCAKFPCDRWSTFSKQSTAKFGRISNSIEISLVGRAPGTCKFEIWVSWSSSVMQWLDLKRGHQDSSSCNGCQGGKQWSIIKPQWVLIIVLVVKCALMRQSNNESVEASELTPPSIVIRCTLTRRVVTCLSGPLPRLPRMTTMCTLTRRWRLSMSKLSCQSRTCHRSMWRRNINGSAWMALQVGVTTGVLSVYLWVIASNL